IVASAGEAVAAAKALGYPVVLKALAPGVAHKNRMGLVVTQLGDEQALREAYDRLNSQVASQGFQRAGVPLILQPMKRAKIELIVGATHEPPFGHFLVAGLGGIYTEALGESVLMPVTVAPGAMKRKIAATRLGRVLAAIDESSPRARACDGLIATLEAVQRLVLAHGDRIESVDINPLLAGYEGCVAVDALVVLRD